MEVKRLLEFLHTAEKLKCNTRHSWTSTGRRESVAEHCWRLSLMAYLLKDEVPEVDMDKVIVMCLCHDLGEAITGDIPAFWKNENDEKVEEKAVYSLADSLPEPYQGEMKALFEEMWAMETPEAKLVKALDKIEALVSHEEGSLDTWLPIEYTKNLTYGKEEVKAFPYTEALWQAVQQELIEKVEKGKEDQAKGGSSYVE